MRQMDDRRSYIYVNTALAALIGLNKAIVLTKVSAWMAVNRKNGHNFHDGRYWVRNTYQQWRENDFPFWSDRTIRGLFADLERDGLLLSSDAYNKRPGDKTKWYTIDDTAFQSTIGETMWQILPHAYGKICQTVTNISYQNNKNNNAPHPTLRAGEGCRGGGGQISSEALANPVVEQPVFSPLAGQGKADRPNLSACCARGLPYVSAFLVAYRAFYGESHPYCKQEQLERAEEVMQDFSDACDLPLNSDDITAMTKRFFCEVDSNDHCLNHFATQGILEVSYAAVFGFPPYRGWGLA